VGRSFRSLGGPSETLVWARGADDSLPEELLRRGWDSEVGVVRPGDLSSSYFTALAVAVLLVVWVLSCRVALVYLALQIDHIPVSV
jgi:hypothetical protein